MKKILLFINFLFYLSVSAQQDPEYTHYMYNMSVVNPAYATGTAAMMNLGGLYRTQWVGAVGAPKTFNFLLIPLNFKNTFKTNIISPKNTRLQI